MSNNQMQTLRENIRLMPSGRLLDLLIKCARNVYKLNSEPVEEEKGYTLACKIASVMDAEERLYIVAKQYVKDWEARNK